MPLLIESEPGAQFTRSACDGLQMMLVLDGAFNDNGRVYQRGEFHVLERCGKAQMQADRRTGCLSLTVGCSIEKSTGIRAFMRRLFGRE